MLNSDPISSIWGGAEDHVDVTWLSRQQELRAGPLPLESWVSGCLGTDWYLKAEFQFWFLFTRPTECAGLPSESDEIILRALPKANIFANKGKQRIWTINYVIESQTLLLPGASDKTTPNQKPEFYFNLNHPDHSRILLEWPRQIASIFCFTLLVKTRLLVITSGMRSI